MAKALVRQLSLKMRAFRDTSPDPQDRIPTFQRFNVFSAFNRYLLVATSRLPAFSPREACQLGYYGVLFRTFPGTLRKQQRVPVAQS